LLAYVIVNLARKYEMHCSLDWSSKISIKFRITRIRIHIKVLSNDANNDDAIDWLTEKTRASKEMTDPAAWPSRCHALQSSTMEKLRDLIHVCVPENGTVRSWSPLRSQDRVTTKQSQEDSNGGIHIGHDDPTYWIISFYKSSPVDKSAVSPGCQVEMVFYAARKIRRVRKFSGKFAPYPLLHCSLLVLPFCH